MQPTTSAEYYHKGSIDVLTSVIIVLESNMESGIDFTLPEVVEMMRAIKVSIEAKKAIEKLP